MIVCHCPYVHVIIIIMVILNQFNCIRLLLSLTVFVVHVRPCWVQSNQTNPVSWTEYMDQHLIAFQRLINIVSSSHVEATTTSPELETSTLVHPDFRQSVLDSGNGTFLGNVKQLNLSNMDSIRAFISKFYTNFTNP